MHSVLSGLTPESAEMYEQYRYNYESDPFAEDTIEAEEELMNTISEERRKSWQTLIESTDMTQEGGRLGQRYENFATIHERQSSTTTLQHYSTTALQHYNTTALQHYNTTANQVAHQLLLNGRRRQTNSPKQVLIGNDTSMTRGLQDPSMKP